MLDHSSSEGRLGEPGQRTSERAHMNMIKTKVGVGGRRR